jgi:hypothetical protein
VITFLRAFVFGLGIFSIFLGVAGKLYGVGDNKAAFLLLAVGTLALALRFALFRRRAPASPK